MKKLILFISLLICTISAFSQQYMRAYDIESFKRLEAKRAFVLGGDSVYATTKMIPEDTIIVTKLFLESEIDSASIAMQEPDSIGQFPVWNPDSGFFIMDNVYNYATQTDLQNLEHSSTNNLGWIVSGHTSSANKIAAFDATGAATTLDTIIDLASQHDLVEKVTGPASSTDNAIAVYDGTTGKRIKNSTGTLSTGGVLTIPSYMSATNVRLSEIVSTTGAFVGASTVGSLSTVSNVLTYSSNHIRMGNSTTAGKVNVYNTSPFIGLNRAMSTGYETTSVHGSSAIYPSTGLMIATYAQSSNTIANNIWIRNDGTIYLGYASATGRNTVDRAQVNGSIQATTAKFTNLSPSYFPVHTDDAIGLVDGNVFQTGGKMQYATSITTFDNNNDIPNVGWVNSVAVGNSPKLPVDAATTANITLSGTQTIDSYAVTAGMRVLVKNQSTESQNGVYTVASGAWTRTTDLDTWAELYKAYVAVLNGTVNGGASYVCTIASTGTLETDPITWALYNAPANILVNAPLSKTGNTISLSYDANTLAVASNALKVKDNTFQPFATVLTNTTASFTTALETKLNEIADGAEVNVNADWNASSGDAQILNKPTLLSQFTNDLGNYGGFLTSEQDPIFAADSSKILHWSDTLNTTKGIASQYDLTTGLATKQNTLTTGNLTEGITGLEFSNARQVIGGATQLNLTSGYFIPTTTEQTQWTGAYNDKINSLAFSGTTTKTLTLTQQDGGTVSNTFTDLDVQTLTADSTTSTIGITVSGSNSRIHFNVDKSATNELQNLSKSKTGNNVTVNISNGTGTTFSVADSDSLPTNELNNSVSWNNTTNEFTVNDAGGNKTATITGFLESEVDGSITNELQTISTSGAAGNITLSNGGGTLNINVNDGDANATNEIQTLSKDSVNITNGKRYGISISSGNRITVTDMDTYPGSTWAGTANNSSNWNTAYTDRMKWDGGSTGLVAATGRTSLGGTTIGQSVFTSTNPSAITFLRANADNTVSWLNAADFRTAIGAGTSSTNGTVTSVAMTTPTGLTVTGSPITSSGTLALALTSGYSIPTTASQSNWDAAYTHSTTTTGSIHGSTTVGGNLLRLINPSAITFLRVNADNTVSALSASDFRTAIGVGTGTGTVTSVSGTGSVNGITLSGTVTTSGSLTLGGSISGLTTSNLSASAGITNSQLANSSVTVNGNSVSLGGSTTVTANTTNALTLKVNTGTTEGTNLYTFNGSAAKTLDIKSGSNVSFSTAAGSLTINSSDQYTGTVTSVGMTVPTGFSISGSPVTSSGTLGLTFTPGYSLPTTASQSNWDAAYGWGNHAVAGYLTQSSFNSGNADLAAIEAISGTTGLLRKTAANSWSLDNAPYITGNQTITLSGAVTGSGTTAITTTLADNAVTSTKLQDNSVTFAKLSDYGTPSNGDFLTYSSVYGLSWTTPNYVPTSRTLTINGTAYDLSANRSWTVSASPAGSNTQVQYNNVGSLGASANFTFNSGTGVVTATNFQLGSDRRYKIKIRKLSELEWVDDIQFVSFRMKQNKKVERYGVVAQQVEKVNPNLVSENADGYKAVSYTDLLIAKVARQDEQIKELTERLERLEKLLLTK